MSSDTPDKTLPTKEDLLKELETIKSSLQYNDQDYSDQESIDQEGIDQEYIDQQTPAPRPSEPDARPETGNGVSQPPPTPETPHDEDDIELVDEEDLINTPALPGQQSLFDEPDHHPKSAGDNGKATTRPTAKGENPFLPSHIRARLQQNKTSLLAELAQVGATLSRPEAGEAVAKPAEKADPDNSGSQPDAKACEAIVDELVAHYLPEIELALRQRLTELVKSGSTH